MRFLGLGTRKVAAVSLLSRMYIDITILDLIFCTDYYVVPT